MSSTSGIIDRRRRHRRRNKQTRCSDPCSPPPSTCTKEEKREDCQNSNSSSRESAYFTSSDNVPSVDVSQIGCGSCDCAKGPQGKPGPSALLGTGANVFGPPDLVPNADPVGLIGPLAARSKKPVTWVISGTVPVAVLNSSGSTITGVVEFLIQRGDGTIVGQWQETITVPATSTVYKTISFETRDTPPGNPGQTLYTLLASWTTTSSAPLTYPNNSNVTMSVWAAPA